MEHINTDKILKEMRNFEPRCFGDKVVGIEMNPKDFKYLKANPGFPLNIDKAITSIKEPREINQFRTLQVETLFGMKIVTDLELNIGEFHIFGIPRLKRWQ